jgi:putative membrane protein
MDISGILVSLLLGGLAVIVVAKLVPGFRIRGGIGSAILVGAVYGVLKIVLQTFLIVLTLPLVILTLGLFILVINAFLLWLTDKLMTRFTVRGFGSLMLGALLMSIIDLAMQLSLRHSALF